MTDLEVYKVFKEIGSRDPKIHAIPLSMVVELIQRREGVDSFSWVDADHAAQRLAGMGLLKLVYNCLYTYHLTDNILAEMALDD